MKKPIYLDHHSTTPVDERVLAAMLPFFNEHFGNPSSQDHVWGWTAKEAIETARKQIADLIGAKSETLIFTSGATESNNLAWTGLAKSYPHQKHLITCALEHSAVLATARALEKDGHKLTILAVDQNGKINLEDLANAIRPDTLLVSIQIANNEVGTLQAVREIGKICKSKNVFFHADAAQAGAIISIDVEKDGIDLVSLSAHKMYGPKGVGALYVRKDNPQVLLSPLLHGGDQEKGIRPGTLNVPGIVGFGMACEIAKKEMHRDQEHVHALSEFLYSELKTIYPKLVRNGHPTDHLPNNLHVSFLELEAESIIQHLPDIAVSTGAACNSHKREPSHVLKAMGIDANTIHASIRFGLGRFTTREEILATVKRFQAILPALIKQSERN